MGKSLFFLIIFFFSALSILGQEANLSAGNNSRYLEDQFYAGIAYNFLTDLPSDETIQRNLSYNIHFGFIKDIPINRKRNFGLGVGIGYDTNSYYSNIIATEINSAINYQLSVSSDSLNRSKFETHSIAFPLELRWRTSNAEDYKFWRIYAGVKAEYLFSRLSVARFNSQNENLKFTNNDISQWQYGLTLNFGYNTWNIHLYYSLAPLLKGSALLDNQAIKFRPLRVGVVFYIL
ncbi:porin family protein [Croceitalea vernalis]|uniref:Porin family protein n=1 Tax=Croceitalea vernalis TaxID=3075599 RepID=A0ABU3BFL5_9FLAO|nr:porin family protein [Croceitalea sp. P007]MDT0620961.1 porin family protein [Croceitalea sp. P007]